MIIAAIEGEFSLLDGELGQLISVRAGDWTVTPAGVPHAFTSQAPGKLVVGYSADIGFCDIEAFDPSLLSKGTEKSE